MSIFDDLTGLMPHSIEIAPRTGESEGDPTYGDWVTYTPCQIYQGPVRYRSDRGDVEIGSGQAIIAPEPVVTADSKARLPDGIEVPITHIHRYPDESGITFQVVIFGP